MVSDIFEAVQSDDTAVLRKMMKSDPDARNARDAHGMPPLYTAARHGNTAAIEILLEAGAELDIFACCYLQRPAECRLLLKQTPMLVHATTADGQTPLHFAARKGSSEIALTLINGGADVNASDHNDITPLHEAAHGGPWKAAADEELIELLIASGAHVDIHLAAAIGRADLLDTRLHECPDQVDSRDENGFTPLYYAAHNSHRACVDLLISRSADVNYACADGQTPLSTAALHLLSQQCDPEICRTLITHGAPYDIHTASALGDVRRISELLKQDASLTNQSLYGFRPADYAVHCGQTESLKTLLEAGADPHAIDETGQSLLSKSAHLPALHQLLMQYAG